MDKPDLHKVTYDLLLLADAQKAAALEYSEALESYAEALGVSKSTLRKFVAARASGKASEAKRDAGQLFDLFDEAGIVEADDSDVERFEKAA